MATLVWNQLLASLPDPHILQTYEWGQVKSRFGWEPSWVVWYGTPESIITSRLEKLPAKVPILGLAQILQRRISIRSRTTRWKILYVPKGPILYDWENESLRKRILDDLKVYSKDSDAIFIKIDPDVRLGLGAPDDPGRSDDPLGHSMVGELTDRGWRYSREQVQFRNTMLIDLSPSEEQLLARMKQKTRYNVRLALRKGVRVKEGGLADLDLLYGMYSDTSLRDGFVIRPAEYYHMVWETFIRDGMAIPLIAEVDGEAIAAIFIFTFQKKAWYLYGMSRDLHREMMPNYLLQWEGMRRAKAAGCLDYDLWGAPTDFNETDPLWGVYRFKVGLGGQVVRHIGAWDLPLHHTAYQLYLQILPRLLGILRRRGMAGARQSKLLEMGFHQLSQELT